MAAGRGGLARSLVEFAVTDAIEKALPLVTVIHEHPARPVASDSHQHVFGAPGSRARRGHGRGGQGVRRHERDLNRPVPVTRPPPFLRGQVDAEFVYGRLPGHWCILLGRQGAAWQPQG